jgi:hypothetical protein
LPLSVLKEPRAVFPSIAIVSRGLSCFIARTQFIKQASISSGFSAANTRL